MSLYQLQRTMSTDTLVGVNVNGSKVDLSTPTNGDSTFNFQIVQKPASDPPIENELTGNTLQGHSENMQLRDSSLIEEFLNIENVAGDRSPKLKRRLSISEYRSSKQGYYEYEFFEKGIHKGETEDDEEIMVTDDEGLDILSFPFRKQRKDSVFSDYGNEMVMNFTPEAFIPAASPPVSEEMFVDSIPLNGAETPQRKKVKDYFKLNLFGATKNDLPVIDPELLDEEPQPILRKKYFWSRKPTIPVSGTLNASEPVVNPFELLASNTVDAQYSLSTESTHFSTIDTAQQPSELINEAGVVKKKLGFPKTRGRKPSPILDASKQFACEFCDRRFRRQEHLKRHVRSLHMGEKPYGCHICGKKFSRSDNLNQHIKTHGGESV